jgi:hypothetical protein
LSYHTLPDSLSKTTLADVNPIVDTAMLILELVRVIPTDGHARGVSHRFRPCSIYTYVRRLLHISEGWRGAGGCDVCRLVEAKASGMQLAMAIRTEDHALADFLQNACFTPTVVPDSSP